MKVVYSCSTSIGASGLGVDSFELVRGLYEKGLLKKGVFFGNRQKEIPRSYLRVIHIHPMKIFASTPARYYYPLKRIYLDWVTSNIIRKGCEIFHGWSTESIGSLRAAREVGAIGFIERASPHPLEAQSLLSEEYERQGIPRAPLKEKSFLKRIEASSRDLTVGVEEFALADYIVAESVFSRESFLKQGVPLNKILVIPRGVDVQRFSPIPHKNGSPFRVLFVGQLCFRKGVHYLLEAWSSLKLKDAELVLAGGIHEEVKGNLNRYKNDTSIKHVGFVKDPETLYRESSVFALPSIVEGSAKVTYEAMAAGLPVIVTPNAGSVARDGLDGYIVPIRNVDALMERIHDLYKNKVLREEMGENARKWMGEHTWDHHRSKMIKAYEDAYNLIKK